MKYNRIYMTLLLGLSFLCAVFVPGNMGTLCAFAATGYEQVAAGSDMSRSAEVASYGMVPIYGQDIADGDYRVDTVCSSPFFRITDALLTAEQGELVVRLTMSSDSYLCVYLGAATEAAAAQESDYIFSETETGNSVFTIPVKALNAPLDLASFSKNTNKWYNRKLLFKASSLPADAIAFPVPDYELIGEALDKAGLREEAEMSYAGQESDAAASSNSGGNLLILGAELAKESETDTVSAEKAAEALACEVEEKDGNYSIEVTMTGGSGRASVSSPTWFYVKDGKAYAKLLWSSTYYDYMIVDGVKFYNETTDGSNSTFTIPVMAFDTPMDVIADTTAMGDPVEIAYALTFYQESIGNRNLVPQEAAKKVFLIALIVIVLGGILNHYTKKKRR